MAAKKKETVTTTPPAAKPPRLKADGTPWAPLPPRRPDAVLLAEYIEKKKATVERHAKELKNIDTKIAYFQNRGVVDPVEAEATAKELLGEGMTPEQIDALVAKLNKAKKALSGKTPAEVEAMRLAGVAAKQGAQDGTSEGEQPAPVPPAFVTPVAAAPEPPAFLAAPVG